jgi:hypothetical protein
MQALVEKIMEEAGSLPEGTPISPGSLPQLGSRRAVGSALSRLAQAGRLLRIARGLYVCPLESRFGLRAPAAEKVAHAYSEQRREVAVSTGAVAANFLGLTAQVPIRLAYWTNGRSRTLCVGNQTVEFKHAPAWQLLLADRRAGDALRALAWLGPEKAEAGLVALRRKLEPSAFEELISVAPHMPEWLSHRLTQFADTPPSA